MRYLENEMCTLAAEYNSFKCINWFILNNIYIDKFACEKAIKNDNLNMLELVSKHLGKGSITSIVDYYEFYVIGLQNNSTKCLEYIFNKYLINHIPQKIIKLDIVSYLKFFYNKKITLTGANIIDACKYGSINTLKFYNSKNFKFTKNMISIAKQNYNYNCSTFMESVVKKYSIFSFSSNTSENF